MMKNPSPRSNPAYCNGMEKGLEGKKSEAISRDWPCALFLASRDRLSCEILVSRDGFLGRWQQTVSACYSPL